jgi:hypothetical protein
MDVKKLAQLKKTMPAPVSTVPVVQEAATLSIEGEAGPEFAPEAGEEQTASKEE